MSTGLELIISTICNATFCDAVYDNPLTDTSITKHQLEIQKLTSEINGKHLKIGTYINYPMSWVEKASDGTLEGRGVAFMVVDVLQKRFNFTYEIITPRKNYEIGGDSPEDSLIGLVNSSAVDMAAAFLPVLIKFLHKVDYSRNLDEGVWSMMLKRPTESATGSGLLAPFETNVWYLILAALVSYVPCITFLTKIRAKIVKDGEDHILLSPSFWFVYAAFVKQGTTLSPQANTTRILFASWWIFIILLSSFYTANLTAFLTLSKFTLDIKNTNDLFKKNYRWVTTEGGAIEYMVTEPTEKLFYLSSMVSKGRAEFRSYTDDRNFLPVIFGGAVLVKEEIAIDHIMYDDYLKKTREGINEADRCTYVVAPEAFIKLGRAFAFPRGSYLKKLFDPVFVYLLQAGIIDYLKARDLPSNKMCPLDLQSKDRKLRNSDLMMTYVLMAMGLAAAGAVFIGEFVLRYYVRIKIKKEPKGSIKRKRNSNKKIRFKEDHSSRPPPYDSIFGINARYKSSSNMKTKIINGREYYIVDTVTGDTRLIPMRTPSAFLYQ